MSNYKIYYTLITFVIVVMCLSPGVAYGLTDSRDVKDIGIDEKLGDSVPGDIALHNIANETVTVDELLEGDKPVLLSLVYYGCPRVCNFASDGVLQAVNGLYDLSLGNDFKILTVSFDTEDTPETASEKAPKYLNGLKKGSDIDESWLFLTGDDENIRKLTSAAGFRYKKDGEEFAHASALIILTPEGNIARYLPGIQYDPVDLRLALIEASQGKIGSSELLNQVLLFCYGFDPIGKRYALKALNIIKASGVFTLFVLCGVLTYFWRREKNEPQ